MAIDQMQRQITVVFWVVTASEVAVLATTFLPYDLEDKKPLVETPEEVRWFFTVTRNGGISTFSILYHLYNLIYIYVYIYIPSGYDSHGELENDP